MGQESNKGYKRLNVWEESHKLVLLVYKVTELFPKQEIFGLTPQLRRAVVSITANIVEGHVKHSKKEFLHHLDFSIGNLLHGLIRSLKKT